MDLPLKRLREQARASEPMVRSVALLRIARVQATVDREAALAIFAEGLAEIEELRGKERVFFLEQARMLAAAAFPELLKTIPAQIHVRYSPVARQFKTDSIAWVMAQHGHVEALFEYVMDSDEPGEFPFRMIPTLLQNVGDEERRRRVVRRAVEMWRVERDEGFYMMFQSQWKVLPEDEARGVLREIVHRLREEPDGEMSATYERVVITSVRENRLFLLLPALRHLDGALTDSLLAEFAQLAEASRRFPLGMETMMQEAEERRKQMEGQSCEGGFVMAGDPRDREYMMSLREATRSGEFDAVLEHALKQFEEDTSDENGNIAPKEFWASTGRFRSIFYQVGKKLGMEGGRYLERIPDADVRLFAEIHLASAVAGLPDLPVVTRRYGRPPSSPDERGKAMRLDLGRHGAPMQSPSGAMIRCPACEWKPDAGRRWVCRCGHEWNTFWTGGLCPSCKYQWAETGCFACHAMSPHRDWYVQG